MCLVSVAGMSESHAVLTLIAYGVFPLLKSATGFTTRSDIGPARDMTDGQKERTAADVWFEMRVL